MGLEMGIVNSIYLYKLRIMKKIIVGFALLATPVAVFAQNLRVGTGQDLGALITFFQAVLSAATMLIIAAAVVWFLYGVLMFVGAKDSEARDEGRNKIIAGIIGIAVMTSVWGLVRWVTNTAGTGSAGAPTVNPGQLLPGGF